MRLPSFHWWPLAGALFALSFPVSLCAGEGGEEDANEVLDTIVVVATKIPQPRSRIAAQITVIDAADIRRTLAEDVDGILRYEPGLELETEGTRFSPSGINIRGIGGNRVEIVIDDVPLRDQFAVGSYSNGGRLLVETDRVKRVEVLHGPASVMYGSNALGGVVSVTTWDPDDLLARSGGQAAFELRGGYQGMNDSRVVSGMAARGGGSHGLLAAATYRSGHELDNQAPAGTPTDPQDWNSSDFMFRYAWDSPGGNRLRLTASALERDVTTRIESLLGYGRRFRFSTAMTGDDHDESQRFVLDYEFSFGSAGQGRVSVFDSRQETDQKTFETRATAPRPVEIERRFLYSQDLSGARGFLSRETAWGRTTHRLALGAEFTRSDIEELRDGLQTGLIDGESSKVILGETLPVRDFPISRTDQAGLWLEDEIRLAGGRWTITPSLRWDQYDLEPRPDVIWREDNPTTEVVPVSEGRVTPRLGVLFRATEHWSLYGQYAEGFRAPPFQDANIGFEVPLFGFRAIPNPDLRSETSQGLEFGLRLLGQDARFSFAWFDSDYDDFIESRVLIGRDPESGDLIFQSRNVERARIHGIDARYEQDLTAWNPRLEGWTLNAAGYWSEGENRVTGAPLNGIAPPQAVIGLQWQSGDARWDLAASATFTSAKKESDIDAGDGERFAVPGWSTLDLTAGWHPRQWVEIRAGVFNLTDKTYWRWLDVANLDAANPMIPLLSRPGRSYSLSLFLAF